MFWSACSHFARDTHRDRELQTQNCSLPRKLPSDESRKDLLRTPFAKTLVVTGFRPVFPPLLQLLWIPRTCLRDLWASVAAAAHEGHASRRRRRRTRSLPWLRPRLCDWNTFYKWYAWVEVGIFYWWQGAIGYLRFNRRLDLSENILKYWSCTGEVLLKDLLLGKSDPEKAFGSN